MSMDSFLLNSILSGSLSEFSFIQYDTLHRVVVSHVVSLYPQHTYKLSLNRDNNTHQKITLRVWTRSLISYDIERDAHVSEVYTDRKRGGLPSSKEAVACSPSCCVMCDSSTLGERMKETKNKNIDSRNLLAVRYKKRIAIHQCHKVISHFSSLFPAVFLFSCVQETET